MKGFKELKETAQSLKFYKLQLLEFSFCHWNKLLQLIPNASTNILVDGAFTIITEGRAAPMNSMNDERAYVTWPARLFPIDAFHEMTRNQSG